MKISVEQFTRKVIEELPDPLTTTAESPAGKNLFTVRNDDDPRDARCRKNAHNSSTGQRHSYFSGRASTAGPPRRCCVSDNWCV